MKLSFAALPLVFATLVAAQNETLVALRGRPVAAPVAGVNYCLMSGNGRNPAGLLLSNCRHPVAVGSKRSLDTGGEQFALGQSAKDEALDEETATLIEISEVVATKESAEPINLEESEEHVKVEEEEALSPDDYTSELEEFEIAEFPAVKKDAEKVIEVAESVNKVEEEVKAVELAPEDASQRLEGESEEEEEEAVAAPASECITYRLTYPAACCPSFYAQVTALESEDDSCEVKMVHTQHACPPPVARVADQLVQKVKLDLFKSMAELEPLNSVTVSCGEGGDYVY